MPLDTPPPAVPTAPAAIIAPALAQTAQGRVVLDIEKRRVVNIQDRPADAGPTCDVLIIGGGVGGVAAAEAAAKRGYSVIIVEPTRVLGGQLTSQVVPVPDENSHIEKEDGPGSDSYRALRERVRAHYAKEPGVVAGREKNIGSCWVSRVSGTPDVWESAIRERLSALPQIRRVYLRHQIAGVGTLSNGRVNYADVADLETGRITRVGTQFLLDASEDGETLALAGCPTTIGQESRETYDEAHAPETARPDWVQSFTYCFLVRWMATPPNTDISSLPIVTRPAEYEYFKSLGEYTLDYVYSERGTVRYKMHSKAEGAGGPFWTYRRLVASSNFKNGASPVGDVALINWRGNDFHEESFLGKPLTEQARILERGREFARGFLYWLQTECPRDDEKGVGYPEIQPFGADTTLTAVDSEGFGLHPYIRESRRLRARFTLTENHLTAESNPNSRWGTEFFDTVGCALYAVDIHPSKGEPPLLFPSLPYHLPLGAFLPRFGPENVLPAAKNFGASRLALASARMHPTEWLAGEVAGNLAAFCLERNIANPAAVRETPELLSEFQTRLRDSGVALRWRDILPPESK